MDKMVRIVRIDVMENEAINSEPYQLNWIKPAAEPASQLHVEVWSSRHSR